MIKYQGLQTLEVLEGADRYNRWIAEKILPYVKSPVLEVGSGTGNISRYFLSIRPFYITDSDIGLVKTLKDRFHRKRDIVVREFDVTKHPPESMRLYFSSIFAINVLEHIENDEKALRNIRAMLKKNGRVALLVPAKKAAYTKLDKILGHYRRYEKKELAEKLKNAGYEIEELRYFNVVGLLSWIVRDKFEKKNFHLKPYQIAAFDMIVPVLQVFERFVQVPVGISLIAVAKKAGND